MMKKLSISGISYAYFEDDVISEIEMSVGQGEFVGIIGGNGSGKSTILKCIYGALRPKGGEILLDGKNLSKQSVKEIAKQVAVVGQENELTFDFSVKEMVAMGRHPHKKLFEPDTPEDKAIIAEALETVALTELQDRNFRNLSGGEKQRTLIARAIAQQADFLILDEPTNHLDICFQLQVFETVRKLGVTVLSAMHDLNLAALFCDRIYILKDKGVYISGTPTELLTSELIYDVFGVRADVQIHAETGRPSVTYIPKTI